MSDPSAFRAKFLPKEAIWKQADAFREKHHPDGSLPVPVLNIAEVELGLEFVPVSGLRQHHDMEALLVPGLKRIYVDKEGFENPKQLFRLNFSVAHEIGHLILHPRQYQGASHKSLEEWLAYFRAIPETEYRKIEWQANEFAGRLLVPRPALEKRLAAVVTKARSAGFAFGSGDDATIEYVSNALNRPFEVSWEVILRHLRNEELWPPP
jgi:hypothetical protein